MRVALHDSDATGFPNLALMKLAAWHKLQGDAVERFQPLFRNMYDKVYSSKVFVFTATDNMLPASTIRGGVGYGRFEDLPDAVEHIMPDYAMFGASHAMGFTTRGCPNSCPWCVVPSKEGKIRPHADVEEFLGGMQSLVLMDNNILASEHGIKQLEKIATLGIKLDCNQGLDARLVDAAVANVLGRVRWIRFVRFACDQVSQMPHVERAVRLLRAASGKKGEVFVYVLVKEIRDALERVEFLRRIGCEPFAQPYRDLTNNAEPAAELKRFARWVNHKAIFKSVPWSEYNGNSAAIRRAEGF